MNFISRCGLLPLGQVSEVLPELLEEDEGDDGVRAQADEGRLVALEEGQRTLTGRERNQVQGTL